MFFRHHRDSVYAVEFLCAKTMPRANGLSTIVAESAADDKTDIHGWFATGSKDHTIALWNLFADSVTNTSA